MWLAKHEKVSRMAQGVRTQRRRAVFGGGSSTTEERDREWTRGMKKGMSGSDAVAE
jgi:hypothetical protein